MLKSVRQGLTALTEVLTTLDRNRLEKAGIYREKLSMYRKGRHLPSSVNLIACLVLFELPIEVTDPETGRTWILKFSQRDTQLTLPLSEP